MSHAVPDWTFLALRAAFVFSAGLFLGALLATTAFDRRSDGPIAASHLRPSRAAYVQAVIALEPEVSHAATEAASRAPRAETSAAAPKPKHTRRY